MHGAFPGLRGLGKLAQIRDLGQEEVGQNVDQVCDMGSGRLSIRSRSSNLRMPWLVAE
jgi:hypothetical protein